MRWAVEESLAPPSAEGTDEFEDAIFRNAGFMDIPSAPRPGMGGPPQMMQPPQQGGPPRPGMVPQGPPGGMMGASKQR